MVRWTFSNKLKWSTGLNETVNFYLYPPLRSQFSEDHDSLLIVIHHNFNTLILLWHELNHQFSTGSTGSTA